MLRPLKKLSPPSPTTPQQPCLSLKMLQLQGQSLAPAESQLHASTLLTWEGGGASAESTERDQLAGERNVRDADSLVVAADRSAAHPYCRLLAPHLHSYAAVLAHSRYIWGSDRPRTYDDLLSPCASYWMCTIWRWFSARYVSITTLKPKY